MKLRDALENYYTFTGKASDVLRQLSFAGLAIVWMFNRQVDSGAKIHEDLMVPAVLFTGALAFDLLQYLFGSVMWGGFSRHMELRKKVPRNKNFKAPRWINWPGNTFFALKAISTSAAYVVLIRYFLKVLI